MSVLDELTTRFKSFGDSLDFNFTAKVKSKQDGRLAAVREHDTDGEISTRAVEDNEAKQQRADLILALLNDGYFSEGFDPVEYELRQLSTESNQEDVDVVVDKLASAVEVCGAIHREWCRVWSSPLIWLRLLARNIGSQRST